VQDIVGKLCLYTPGNIRTRINFNDRSLVDSDSFKWHSIKRDRVRQKEQ
jgi:hypothetical protein